jgi:proteasome lid subunit RPN8/RPN11
MTRHFMTAPASDTFGPTELRGARQVGTLYRDAAVVVIREAVLEAILEFSEQDVTRERGGFLLGGVYGGESPDVAGGTPKYVVGRAPQYIVVRHFHPALEALGSTASLTFTHDTWASLTREIEANFSGESILGWQHTHPGLGVFLSGYDLFIQKNFFAQSWQIALVVDPRRQEFGFFHWRQGEARDCGFICVEDT